MKTVYYKIDNNQHYRYTCLWQSHLLLIIVLVEKLEYFGNGNNYWKLIGKFRSK